MTLHRFITASISLCLCVAVSASAPVRALAEEDTQTLAAKCQQEIYDGLSMAQVLFRARLLGVSAPSDDASGTSRLGPDGKLWIKVSTEEEGAWRRDGTDTVLTNAGMRTAILPEQRGIFQRTQARTSDLVPELTQAFRTLSCHTEAVCRNAQLTEQQASALRSGVRGRPLFPEWVPVQTTGCERIDVQPFPSCYALYTKASVSDQSLVHDTCSSAADSLLDRETDVLKLLTAYDAAYRSFLQFSGVFDTFLVEFKGDLLTPIEQATSVVTQLSRIPCFISQCSE